MQFDLWTFGLQTVNFLVLVWLLKIFLYTPVAKIIERRQAGIRAAQDEADIPAETFFDLLAQRLSQRVDEPVTLLVDVENNDLTLRAEQAVPDVVVRGNELIVGNHRFILQLAPPSEPLPVSV